MRTTDTLKFVFRFLSLNQKRELKKIADGSNNSINQEISVAVNSHITKSKKKIR